MCTDVSSKIRSVLIFLYFVLSSAELLHLVMGIFKPKLGHIVALVLLGWMVLEKRMWRLPKPLFHAFIFILSSMIISAVLGHAPLRSLGYVGVYLFNFLIYFFLPFQLMQIVQPDKLLRLYWSSFVVVGCYAVLQLGLSLFGVYEPFALQRVGSLARGQAWTYEPSYYALYILPYVMYHNSLAIIQEGTSRIKLLFQNLLLIVSTSTGLIVSYPAFFGIATFFKEMRKIKLFVAISTFCVSLILATVLFYETVIHTLFKFFYFGLYHFSFSARWEGIVASIKTFLKHPIFGAGLGGVSTERFVAESTYDTKLITLQEFEAFDPTNAFTEILASLGVIGLVAFIYLGIVFYRAFLDAQDKQRGTALFLSLIVMLIALQMNQGLFRPYVWIHAAIVYSFLISNRKILLEVRTQHAGQLHHVDRLF